MPRRTSSPSSSFARVIRGASGGSVLLVLLLMGCDDAAPRGKARVTVDAATQASARTDASHGGFTGVFHASGEGTRSVLNLTDQGGRLTGMLDAANISGQVSGGSATADVRDAGTAARVGTISLALSGDAIVMSLTATDAQGGSALQLPAVTYTRGVPPPIDVQLDAQLAGRWRHTWDAGDGTTGADVWLVLHPDGAVEHGKASAADERALETSGDDGFAGKWRTSDRTLHVMPGSRTHWFAFARYDIDGNRLTLTFNDGSRQVYHRQ